MARMHLLLPVLLLGAGLGAQQADRPDPKQKPKPKQAVPSVAPAASPAPTSDEPGNPDELILARAIPYRVAMQRDPFSAPTDVEQATRGDLVDDIGVKGRIISGGKVYAVVSDSRGNVRRLPVGYRFRDGEIVSIDEKSVTFRQWDVQSTNRSVYRTVVKTFKREEGKR